MEKFSKMINQPKLILFYLDRLGLIRLNDEEYVKILYKKVFNEELDLKHPKNFNQKLQVLKLSSVNDTYTKLVDKYEVKKFVGDIIGNEYIVPTLGMYNSFDEIDFDKLPKQFVIKCTHDSGSTIICKNKSEFDIKKCKKKINKALKTNYYLFGRETPYKNVKPRIIIEEYMEDKKLGQIVDYKVYAFNGKCDYVMACFDRQKGETKFVYYDKNWKRIEDFSEYKGECNLTKPKNLDKMFEFASILSKNIPFVRVDFYEINEKLYFGEMTFYPSSGFDVDRTKECADKLNELLRLEE